MSLPEILTYLLTPIGAGVLDALLIALLVKLTQDALPAWARFYGAMLLAAAIPGGAYWAEIALGYATFSWLGVIEAAGVAYAVSQTVHWETAGKQSAALARTAM